LNINYSEQDKDWANNIEGNPVYITKTEKWR